MYLNVPGLTDASLTPQESHHSLSLVSKSLLGKTTGSPEAVVSANRLGHWRSSGTTRKRLIGSVICIRSNTIGIKRWCIAVAQLSDFI
ncbi:unnamed protein product [Protopolystoma xenopodis]|uniref:Uncharacterized protein n=1 Tax=Protopolystoma xenopodis TaxID=117903 RepID=A0A3S5FCE0_9PLAT|nr:unnamed protein product [Protopolystoma xenopodis]